MDGRKVSCPISRTAHLPSSSPGHTKRTYILFSKSSSDYQLPLTYKNLQDDISDLLEEMFTK